METACGQCGGEQPTVGLGCRAERRVEVLVWGP